MPILPYEYHVQNYQAFKRFIGDRIRHYRVSGRLSEEELAIRSECTIDEIRSYQDGSGEFNLHTVYRICCSLALDPELIFDYRLPE